MSLGAIWLLGMASWLPSVGITRNPRLPAHSATMSVVCCSTRTTRASSNSSYGRWASLSPVHSAKSAEPQFASNPANIDRISVAGASHAALPHFVVSGWKVAVARQSWSGSPPST